MKVLVVDDSARLRESVAAGLHAFGMVVEAAADGRDALARMRTAEFDVVILDLVMPGVGGREVLAATRNWRRKPRILVLSALDHHTDRVEAIDLGADDYLVKPFALDELRARVQALARRPVDGAAPLLESGRLTIDTATCVARVDGVALALTPKEYGLIEVLLRRRGHVFSRSALFERLYDSDSESSDSVIEVLMSTLRAKLARAGLHQVIETRRGFGYVVP